MKSTALFASFSFLICFTGLCTFSSRAQNAGTDHDALYIAPSGNVGIGTTTPAGRLAVEGKTVLNGEVKIKNVEIDAADATLKVNGRVKDQAGYIMPVGSIIMYVATEADINRYFNNSGEGLPGSPVEGWAICNGEKGRPDLRGRFVVGADERYSKGSQSYKLDREYTPQATGGKSYVELSKEQLPAHSHTIAGFSIGQAMYSTSGFGCTCTDNKTGFVQGWTGDVGNHGAEGKIGQTGEGKPFDNRPPYYVVFYLMKL